MTDPSLLVGLEAAPRAALLPAPADEARQAPALPRDHPAWARDLVAISSRTRAMLQAIGPTVVRVLTFWDHRVRSVVVGARSVAVDAAGCYRLR
jgi:hypothetical protein